MLKINEAAVCLLIIWGIFFIVVFLMIQHGRLKNILISALFATAVCLFSICVSQSYYKLNTPVTVLEKQDGISIVKQNLNAFYKKMEDLYEHYTKR